jgi:NAD(P)-dependent dehydrogenase (short-subunit alcohol dehydrogenase family)
MTSHEGKIVLVTGASSGIGKAAVFFLAGKGVKAITLFARRKENLEEVAKELASKYPGVKTLVVAGDTAVAADNQRAVDETVKEFGGTTSAFVNAGIYKDGATISEVDDETIDEVLNVNVKGVIYALRSIFPAIAKTVGEDGPTGSVVVTSSCMGASVVAPKSAGSSIYSASKAFVNSLVQTAAIENAPHIRVNGVMPGVVKTNIVPVDDATYEQIGAAMQPLWNRPGKSDEIASLVSYLLGDEASFISGTNIFADGLWSLSAGGM